MAQKYSYMLHQAIVYQQSGDNENAKKELEKITLSTSAPNGVKSLASLRLAAFLIVENDIESAIIYLARLIIVDFCDAYIRDLAGLFKLTKTMISTKMENLNEEELIV